MRHAPLHKRLVAVLLALAATSGAAASEALHAVFITSAEGTVTVDAQGKVTELVLETPLGPLLAPAVERSLRAMRFKPVMVGGVPTAAHAAFAVQLAGEQVAGDLRVTFDGINFHAPKGSKEEKTDRKAIAWRKVVPPKYPGDLQIAGVMGEVRLALLVSPEGRVAKASVVRSSLFGAEHKGVTALSHLRSLERASLDATRRWTFTVPAERATGPDEQRTAMTSVVFVLDVAPDAFAPGRWIEVRRMAARPVPWLDPETDRMAADRLGPGGGLAPVAGALELAQPLAGTAVL